MSQHYRKPARDVRRKLDATLRGRKRRAEDAPRTDVTKRRRTELGEYRAEDVPRTDATKRRRTELGEGTSNTTRPIVFKELENICREGVPENGILGLANKAQRFEALLASDEIRPDLMKLVISAFRLLCSANRNLMTENAEKLLRSPIAKTFMTGTVLSRFINEMPHSECWKDENDRVSVISDLTEIFLALIPRFGESIVHTLPLAQLSTSLEELKENNLIKDTSELDKKVQQVKELKNEVIRRAKSAHDQESDVEPPQNFREISVIPQAADLCFRPFLRENITDRKFKDLDHYLDVQFRLLREDFVMPLRNGIKQLTKESNSLETSPASKDKRVNDVSVYHDVTVLYPVPNKKGRVYRIRFNLSHPKVKRVKWERSKRLKFGSLVCLSSDEFNTLVFATIENRDADGLKVGELEVRFENVEMVEINKFIQGKEAFVMIESPAYFEAYRHVLEALKEIKPDEFPFQKHIVECCQNVGPPEYQVKKENNSAFTFNFTGVLVTKASANPATPTLHHESHSSTEIIQDSSSKESQSESVNSQNTSSGMDVQMDNEMPSAEVKQDCTPNIQYWPDSESLGFNESQMRAFKMALTKKFAVIQGPPGTGKTYVGLKIARVLLQTATLWEDGEERSPILMVSYTNHALDQFLEGLLPMTKDVVRVGGRSRNKNLDDFSLKCLRKRQRQNRLVPGRIYGARMETKRDAEMQKVSFERSSEVLRTLRTSVVSVKVLGHQDYMLRAHYTQLLENAEEESIDEVLLNWLHVKRKGRDEQEDHFDYWEMFSLPEFDNNPFNDKDLHAVSSSQVAALYVEEADNPSHLRRNLANEDVMAEDDEMVILDIYRLETRARWRLYKLWLQRVEVHHQGLLQARQVEYERALEREQEVSRMEEYDILRRARVIGMTTTCAARYRRILQQIRPKIVLVEEAAEVLEAHIITSLTNGCEHLILIGDHQQLRPTPEVYELAKKYKLDVSLFERMVNVGIQCERLSVQHRMRPEIAALMKHIYGDLENHESVEKYEDIKGMKKNMFFVNHSHLENTSDEHSHFNEHEARFLVALCRYLLQQGYRSDQITLLTTYMGQMFAIRDCLKDEDEEAVRKVNVMTVDNFQGEENDIILLSLVRSNKTEKVGFIKIVNRACVALSRAKKGFYCIGNFALLSKHSDIWNKIVADLKANGSIGNALPLVCQIHNDEVTAETAEDFNTKAPDGGCQRPCKVRLECGHACKHSCHPYDSEHVEYCCGEPCAKKIVGCDHVCPKLCYQACELHCGIMVTKEIPACGHTAQVRCDTSPRSVTCTKRCEKTLSCGHRCQNYCGDACTDKCKEFVKITDWSCEHEVTAACSATPADCSVPCRDMLECGHKCSGTCGECRMGRVHKRCKLRCGRPLVCSHVCKEFCRMPCPPCTMKCENRCVHSNCEKRCGDLCVSCLEKCSWECPHYQCSKYCGELCDRPRCNEPCDKRLPCNHVCRGLKCQKECICAECMKNDDSDPITDILFGGEDEEDARFIKLPDCQHIFAVNDLDRYMDDDTNDSHVIQLKPCPRCKTPIRTSLRYGNVIKQQLHDIEKVKAKLLGNSSELEEKRWRLLRRAYLLRPRTADWEKLERSISKLKSGLMAAITENKLTLMERLLELREKMQRILRPVSPEDNLQRSRRFDDELCSLQKRFMSDGVTQKELRDINTEFSRLNLQLELCLLSHDIKSLALELDEDSRQMMTAIQDELSSGKRIEDEKLDEMMNNLKDIRRAHTLSPLTPEEKKAIVSAIGLSKGHWYKCPQGHIYAIGECGGANQRSTCPECGAAIGGANHRLEEGNEQFVAKKTLSPRFHYSSYRNKQTSIRVGDTVLLKAEKSNKLSTNFCPSPFKVVQKTGREVTVRNEAGVEYKRNTAFVKRYNEQVGVSRDGGNGNGADGQKLEVVIPTETVSRNSLVPPVSSSENEGVEAERQVSAASPLSSQETVRRSTRVVRKPSRFKDYVQ